MSESLLIYHHLTIASCRAPNPRIIAAIPPTKWQYVLALAVKTAVASVSCDCSALRQDADYKDYPSTRSCALKICLGADRCLQ